MIQHTPSQVSLSAEATAVVEQRVTRRKLLQFMALGGATIAGGALLSACGGTSSSSVSVNLYAAGSWPINSMPTKDVQAKDPFEKAYASWLAQWLKDNPGVKISASSANIWDAKALSTAIGAGTAPGWYLSSVLGGDDAGTRAAFARGMVADTTDLFAQYHPQMHLSPWAYNAWQSEWKVAGRYYGAPGDYFPGRGIYYRRDLLQAAGLQEPKAGWTWSDLRAMAKALTTKEHKGIVFQNTTLSYLLSSNQFGLLTQLPTNSGSQWHWKADYSSKADEWSRLVNLYRGMAFTDQSVLQDVTYVEAQAEQAFFRGDVAMAEMHSSFYTHPAAGDPNSPSALAQKLGKPLADVVGYVIDPVGDNGAFGAVQGSLGIVSMDPHLNKTALDKAFNLYASFWLIDGVVKCNQASYKADPTPLNAASIYQAVTSTNSANLQISGIPGNDRTYWGDKVVSSLLEGTNVPIIPNYSVYVPAEQTAGPPPQALADAMTKLAFSQDNVKDILSTLEQTQNQQAGSLSSNASQSDFNRGAKNYYKAVGSFWQKNGPAFYNNEYLPWYKKYIVPVIGE